MESSPPKEEGLRERKRRETLHRIAEQGLKLFLTNGYEATTLDAIAEAAGISRRTFFYYFKSKEEILLAWQDGGFTETLRAAVLEQSTKQSPLNAVKNALLELTIRFQADYKQTRVIERLMCSNEALRIRHQAKYVEQEASGIRRALPDVAAAEAAACAPHCRHDVDRSTSSCDRQLEPRRRGSDRSSIYLKEAFADLKSEI